jgi:peptidoglycan/LPS O-acetylase OafA/YrhL
MDFIDQLPAWLKALAAMLWALFVLVPTVFWLAYRFGEPALGASVPVMAAAFWIICSRALDEDISDAEYYRRKAQARQSMTE